MAKVTLKFRAKDGSVFKKTFKGLFSAKRAVAGWKSKGGKMVGGKKEAIRVSNALGSKYKVCSYDTGDCWYVLASSEKAAISKMEKQLGSRSVGDLYVH